MVRNERAVGGEDEAGADRRRRGRGQVRLPLGRWLESDSGNVRSTHHRTSHEQRVIATL